MGPDADGRFGAYGGRFISETLAPLVLDLAADFGDSSWGHTPAIVYSNYGSGHPLYLVAPELGPMDFDPNHQDTLRIGAVFYDDIEEEYCYMYYDLTGGGLSDWFDHPGEVDVPGSNDLNIMQSRFLHATYVPGEDSGRIWCAFHCRASDQDETALPFGMVRIRDRDRVRVSECRHRLLEGDTVFPQVRRRLAGVPLELKIHPESYPRREGADQSDLTMCVSAAGLALRCRPLGRGLRARRLQTLVRQPGFAAFANEREDLRQGHVRRHRGDVKRRRHRAHRLEREESAVAPPDAHFPLARRLIEEARELLPRFGIRVGLHLTPQGRKCGLPRRPCAISGQA